MIVAVGDTAADSSRLVASLPHPDDRLIDAVVHIRLNWAGPPTPDEKRLTVDTGDPKQGTPALVALTVDINHNPLPVEPLEQYVPSTQHQPMLLLYLLECLDRQSLPPQEDAAWKTLRTFVIRQLAVAAFGSPRAAELARECLGEPVRSGMDMLPDVLRILFQRRYPEYVTVIKTPRWRDKLGEYTKLLSDTRIPLAVRRGMEPWTVPDDYASRILGVNKMNLSSTFAGLESLIEVSSKGRGKGVEIIFHVHPLERKIRELVEASPLPKRMFDGHICPWIPFYKRLATDIFASGYLINEILAIFDIGHQREMFSICKVDDSIKIYSLPLDVPAMQAGLKEKLDKVQKLDREVSTLGATSLAGTLEELSKEINGLQDEVGYDRLMRRIDEERERVLRNISEFCQRLEQRITAAANKASEMRQALEGAGTAGLTRELSGRTSWVGELDRVRVYLLLTVQEMRSRLAQALESVEPTRAVARDLPEAPVRQRIERLRDALGKIGELETTVVDAEKKIADLLRQVRTFSNWRQLRAMSDELHDAISRLENEPVHREQAVTLRTKYDSISAQIANMLMARHVQALETGEQWKQQIVDLEQEIGNYQKGIRDRFIAVKGRASQLLREVGLGEVQLRQGFDDAEASASYQRLFQEAEARLREAIRREEEGLQKQRIEVVYQRDVLRCLVHDEGIALQSRLEEAMEKLVEASRTATAAEIETAVGRFTEWPRGGLADIGSQWVALREALTAAREAQRRVRPPGPAGDPQSEEARKLFTLLAHGSVRDLKDLVLGMLREGGNSSTVLDVSLKALEELFRLGHVEIKVQRALRR